ncbi:hypothetical protein [Maribacter sp. IgM3_T14_3]|uniref:hypothetical protein n=1 Tax=Maribacter sp. IgM3_T14_3 TaxID=3415140 RepID=UPI003C6FF61C
MTKIFKIPPISLGNNNFIHIIEIETIDQDFGNFINEKIGLITEGSTDTEIPKIKTRLYEFLQRKKGTTIEMGAVAEFMVHLYMNENGFKQEFVFFNLEERSIKKGFDGYYTINNEEWILESKSGSISTSGISHKSKFLEAYSDLEKKVKDSEGNNPWRNAYNHACHRPVESAEDIIKNLKTLAEDFDSGVYKKIENLNLLPATTIFLEGNWNYIDQITLITDIKTALTKKKFKGINILCIHNKSLELLENFLTT